MEIKEYKDPFEDREEWDTLSPILQLHIRKLFVAGELSDAKSAAKIVQSIDAKVNPIQVESFFLAHKDNEDWVQDRTSFLSAAYGRMLDDKQLITEHIDEHYDTKIFLRARNILERILTKLDESEDGIKPGELKTLISAGVELHSAQRKVRKLGEEKEEGGPQKWLEKRIGKLEDTVIGKIVDDSAKIAATSALQPL